MVELVLRELPSGHVYEVVGSLLLNGSVNLVEMSCVTELTAGVRVYLHGFFKALISYLLSDTLQSELPFMLLGPA